MLIEKVTVPIGERGKWRVSRFVITEEESKFTALRDAFNPHREAREHLPEGIYTQLTCQGRGIVMSDTPSEMRDHYEAVRRARGHVLINGLGLGMVLGAVLAKPEVGRVTVVEIDPDVIALVGPHYACDRLEIVNASAFDYRPRYGDRFAVAWHDIWDTICEDHLPEMTKLKRKYGRLADWQGCWCEPQCRAQKKADSRNRW